MDTGELIAVVRRKESFEAAEPTYSVVHKLKSINSLQDDTITDD